MRPLRLTVVVAVLAAGNARGQETAPATPLAVAAGAPTAVASDSSDSAARGRPSLGTRLANWRPISRWLRRTSATQDTAASAAAVGPARPTQGDEGSARPVPAVNPLEGDPGTTSPGATEAAPATAAGTVSASPGSDPISANPAAVNIIAGTARLGGFSDSTKTPGSDSGASGLATPAVSSPAGGILERGPSTVWRLPT